MKHVLIVYFTQTGQLLKAIDATVSALANQDDVTLHYLPLAPETAYPYPWSYTQFFDIFPDCVREVPCALQPFSVDPTIEFDLVVIGYQPWFLSVCVPVLSFLQTPFASQKLRNKPVITVIACRNMWLTAQEKMKRHLLRLGARLVGNITYVDHAPNLVSLITVLAFVLKGEKNRYLNLFPKYGVADSDLTNMGPACSQVLRKSLLANDYTNLQAKWNDQGAVVIKPNLMLMEGRGNALFPIYAKYVSKNGTATSKDRKTRVRIFGTVLPLLILILSPLITLVSRLAPMLFPARFKKEMAYFAQNGLK